GILFGPESDVNGRLRFGGPVQIDGTFRGAITTDDALLVGEHAKIDADITCGAATIHGTVTGNITAKDAVALEPTSHVKGDVTAPALSVAKGATSDGLSRMGTAPSAKKRENARRRRRPPQWRASRRGPRCSSRRRGRRATAGRAPRGRGAADPAARSRRCVGHACSSRRRQAPIPVERDDRGPDA